MRRKLAAMMALIMILTSVSFPNLTAIAGLRDDYVVVVNSGQGSKRYVATDYGFRLDQGDMSKIDHVVMKASPSIKFWDGSSYQDTITTGPHEGKVQGKLKAFSEEEVSGTILAEIYLNGDPEPVYRESELLRFTVPEDLIPNSGNLSDRYLKGKTVDGYTVTYQIDKGNVEADAGTTLPVDDHNYLNVFTDVKAPAGATVWRFGQNRWGNVHDGYAHIGVTVYDNNDTEKHFVDDKLDGDLRWYATETSDTPISTRKINFSWISTTPEPDHVWDYTDTAQGRLKYTLSGWDNSMKAENDGEDPIIITASDQPGVYDVMLNVKPSLWQKIFDNADVSQGIIMRYYMESPDGSVTYYQADTLGEDRLQDESEMKRLMGNLASSAKWQISMLSQKQTFPREAVTLTECEGGYVVTPIDSSMYDGAAMLYLWCKSADDPDYWTFGPKNANFEAVVIHYSVREEYQTPVKVSNQNKFVDESWITPDSDDSFASMMFASPEFKEAGRLSYSFDDSKIRTIDPEDYLTKPVCTKVTLPEDAKNITVDTPGAIYSIIGNELTFKTILCELDGMSVPPRYKLREYESANELYQFSYTQNIGGTDVTRHKTLAVNWRYQANGIAYDKLGFRPAAYERLRFDTNVSTSDNGFVIETAGGQGEIWTKFTGKPVNMTDVDHSSGHYTTFIQVKAPEIDNATVIGYRINEQNDWKYGDALSDRIRARVTQLQSDDYTPRVTFEDGEEKVAKGYYEYLPYDTEIDGKVVYRIGTRTEVDLANIALIDWIYVENGSTQEKQYLEYYYATTMAGHSDVYMNAAAHTASGLPEASLVAITDSTGDDVDISPYTLKMTYYGREKGAAGTDYDFSLISLVDAAGNYVHFDGGKVEIRFTYPEGISYSDAAKADFKLTHYQDEAGVEKKTESLSYQADGIHVVLSNFSPFLIEWKEVEKPEPKPTPVPSDDDNGSSSSTVVRPDPAVTPIITAADGKQFMGTSMISKPAKDMTEKEKESYIDKGLWQKNAAGYWSLTKADGTKVRSQWALVSDTLSSKPTGNVSWFYFDANGNMLTGWQWILGPDGKQHCYYFNKEDGSLYGACLMGGVSPDGYPLNQNGEYTDQNGNPVLR